jgi:cytochrome P450
MTEPVPFSLGSSRPEAEAAFAELRRRAPVVAVTLPEGLEAWVITRHAEARQVFKDQRFVKDLPALNKAGRGWGGNRYAEDVYVAEGRHMLNSDGTEHRRLRALATTHFNPRTIAGRRGEIEEIATGLVERMAHEPRADLMHDYAEPLPEIVLARILGFSDEAGLRIAAITRRLGIRDNPAEPEMRRAYSDMVDACMEALCRSDLGPDTVMASLQEAVAAGRATRREALSTVMMLLGAGISSTAIAIGSGAARVMSAGATLRALLGGVDTAATLVEELLRHHPPFPFSPWRFTREAVTVAGTTIPANATVFVLLAAVNRDPTAFEDADNVDPLRSTSAHLTFGLGPHYCIGAHLARVEIAVALRVLFGRLPEVRPALDYAALSWRGLLFDRTIESFPVYTGVPVAVA